MVGGSLLLGSIRSMMGGGHHRLRRYRRPWRSGGSQKPWSDQSGSDLARDAGINDIGSSSGSVADDDSSRAGLFDPGIERSTTITTTWIIDSDGFDDDDGDSDYA